MRSGRCRPSGFGIIVAVMEALDTCLDALARAIQSSSLQGSACNSARSLHRHPEPFPASGWKRRPSVDHRVKQGGEPFLLLKLRCFPYTVEPLGHVFPALSPALVLPPFRVSLGPLPFAPLTPPPVVRSCSPASPLLWKGLTSPARASSASTPRLPDTDRSGTTGSVGPEISRFSPKERLCMTGYKTTQGWPRHSQSRARTFCLRHANGVGTLN
jgi:hypothetical protein